MASLKLVPPTECNYNTLTTLTGRVRYAICVVRQRNLILYHTFSLLLLVEATAREATEVAASGELGRFFLDIVDWVVSIRFASLTRGVGCKFTTGTNTPL